MYCIHSLDTLSSISSTKMLVSLLALTGLAASAFAAPSTLLERNPLGGGLHKRCNAYNKGLPTPTSSKTISSPITVKSGQVFDGLYFCVQLIYFAYAEQLDG